MLHYVETVYTLLPDMRKIPSEKTTPVPIRISSTVLIRAARIAKRSHQSRASILRSAISHGIGEVERIFGKLK